MEKIKQFIESDKGKDILVVIIIILVGLGSFELGRLSQKSAGSGLKIDYTSPNDSSLESTVSVSNESNNFSSNTNILEKSPKINSGNFFASNRGSKYYSLRCSGGKTIKESNRRYFNTSTEAEKAGYQLSSSCK